MKTKGISIDVSIEIPPDLNIEAGWCKVFHHSTENFIIGIFIAPIIASIDAGREPLSEYSKELDKDIKPIKKRNKISIDVNLASHTHQTPQIGLPHIAPVIRVRKANIAPTGAIDLDIRSAKGWRQTRKKKQETAIIK